MAYFSRAAFGQRRVEAQFSHETLCPVCDSAGSRYVLSRGEQRLLRCQGCDLIRLEPRKRPSGGLGGAVQDAAVPGAGSAWQPLLEAVQSRVPRDRASLIQIGCAGPVSAQAQETAARLGLRLAAIDPASDAPSVQPSPQAGDPLPLPQFAACVIVEPLEHEGDPLSALLAIRRFLAPEGVLAVAFEALLPPPDRLQAQDLVAGPSTRFLYNRETAESLLFRAGFGRVRIAPPSGAAMPTVVTAVKRYSEDALRRRDKLSIIMPVFNEKATFLEVFELLHAKQLPDLDKEIIVVESNSTDGTKDDVRTIAERPGVEVVWEDRPRGKGHAVRAGLARASGDFVLIQDADLEYDIDDYDILLDPLYRNRAAFVLGVRHGRHGDSWKMRHFEDQFAISQVMNLGHLFFTGLFNVVYGQRLTDPFTMFKVFRRDCIDGMTLECNRFDFDWELVAKLVRRGYAPVEIPVNYASRSFTEGKKVAFFRDPLTWIRACIKYRFVKV